MSNELDKVWTQTEIQDLRRLKTVVDRCFAESGAALREIKDRKLWMIENNTFDEYCQSNWGYTRQRAEQLIDSAVVYKQLPQEAQQFVATESQARALKPVPAAERPKVVQQAVQNAKANGNGKVTARHITEAAQRVTAPAKAKPDAPKMLDKTGWVIPENLVTLFMRFDEVKAQLQHLSALRGLLRRVEETRDPLWLPVNKSMTGASVDQVYAEIRQAVPFAICPYCQGRAETMTHCTVCKGRGVLSEHMWKTAIPEELKAVREKAIKK